jgi:hypothetical protein
MAIHEALDTHHKALSINLEASIFGSFAEIGAGQEVARWFLQVGGASGTVAKTISAYDKEVSDDIYGTSSRYVSEERLNEMLECEWKQLLSQLQQSRGDKTRFFSFVDTIAARNYAGTNYCHGWIGVRFQDTIGGPANDIILHVNLLDPTNLQQQQAVGILGVNLIFAAFHERIDPDTFLKGLAQDVAPDRLEIDYIELRGPVFGPDTVGDWNRRAVSARLVLNGLSEGVIFPKGQAMLAPSDAFHKKSVVLAPGVFTRVEHYHAEMLSKGIDALTSEPENTGNEVLGLFCISSKMNGDLAPITIEEILQRISVLHDFGYGVLLIRDRELYRMSAYAKRFTPLPVRLVAGISLLVRVFTDTYENTVGTRLEGIARMFAQNVRMYAYPMPQSKLKEWMKSNSVTGWDWTASEGWVTADRLMPSTSTKYLYQYVQASQLIIPLHNPTAQESPTSTTVTT